MTVVGGSTWPNLQAGITESVLGGGGSNVTKDILARHV